MSQAKAIMNEPEEIHYSLPHYIIGFLGSIALTLTAYLLVTHHGAGSKHLLAAVLGGLAFVQFVLQIYFFLHLGEERKPRWKLLILLWMASVVLIVVVGSLWIMDNLNTRMTPQQIQQYLKSQDAL